MCGDCAFRRQVGLDQVDFGVHPLEQRELFLDLHPAFLWPTADCVYSCSMSLSSCFSRISLAGSRRQLSIRKNERKGGSDEPDTPLLLERELAVGEVDVVIGGEKSYQANNASNNGFQQGFAVEPQPPPGQRRIQIPRASIHPKQPAPIPTATSLVHAYASAHV